MSGGLPEGWCSATISDIAEVFLGKTPAKDDYVSDGKLKIVKFRDLKDGCVNFSNFKAGFVRADGPFIPGLRELRRGDVLITSAAHSGENIGKKCAFVVDLPPEFDQVFFTGELLNLRCDGEPISRWIYRFFCSLNGYTEIQNAVSGVHLTGGRAQQMVVPLAPLCEQRRIVAKLETLTGKIDVCQKRLAKISVLLRRFRQSVLAAACSGRLTADWRDHNSTVENAETLLGRIREKRLASAQTKKEKAQIEEVFDEPHLRVDEGDLGLNDIPVTWFSCRVGAVGTVSNGGTPSRQEPKFWGGRIPWVSSGEVRNNIISETRERITKAGYEGSSVRLLPSGTVLLAMIGEGKTRGQTAILDIEATINQNIAAIVVEHGLVRSAYLWIWFQLQYEATRERGSGSGPQALNCQRVRELPFILPPLAEQLEIGHRVEELFALADELEARFAKAQAHVDKLVPSLLARAFCGELVPTEAELARREKRDYESASTLLERIHSAHERTARQDKNLAESRRRTQRAGRSDGAASVSRHKPLPAQGRRAF